MADSTPAPAAAESISLLDLDPELLLEAVQTLPLREQARCRQVCKLFYLLVSELERTTPFMATSVGSFDGVMRDLGPKMAAAPSLGVLFTVHAQRDASPTGTLGSLARKLPPGLELVGGQMGVVAGTQASSGALVQSNTVCPHAGAQHAAALSLGRFPAASCKSFAFDAAAPGGWEAQLKAQGCFEGGWKVFLLIARTNEADELVDALQAAHPDAAIIGGMATGDVLYRLRHGAASVVDEGVVGMMFSGNVPLAAFVSRGARVVGEGPYTFGEADLDADPDAPEEQQILTHLTDPRGERQGALTTVLEVVRGCSQGQPTMGVAERPGEGYELTFLSNEMVVAQRGAIRLAPRRGDAPGWEGGAVQFYAFDPQSCKQDLATRLAAMKAETERKGERLLGAVMFTCNGRTHNFFGEAAFDATTFSKTFPATPLIGMYAGGEIGPPLLADAPPSRAFQVGGAGMHGFTAVFGMFIVPGRQPRAAPLAFADGDAIAAAYAELRAQMPPPPPAPPASSADAAAGHLPTSIAELRSLPVRALRQAMDRLGIAFTPGMEKEEIIQEIATRLPAGAEE